MVERHPEVSPTPSQCYMPTYHSMYPQLYHAFHYNQVVMPSVLHLSTLNTSFPQRTKNEADAADDFVKRLFRFSARSEEQHKMDDQKKTVRMVVPTKKATDCSVSELRTTERTRDASDEFGFNLEEDDSGLANDSFSDSL